MKDISTFTLARSLLFVALSIAIACPGLKVYADESGCTVRIAKDRFDEFLSQMRSHPAIRNGQVVGFRIYEKKASPGALAKLGLRSDDLLTHFCGIGLYDALSADSAICCIVKEPAPDRVELTVERDGKLIRVIPPLPNKRVQATRSTRA